MKKLIALLLVLATVMAFAACGKKEETAKVESVEALTALKNEYPYVELTFEAHCEDCGESTEVNLFDYFKRFGAGDFSMG